MDAYHSITIHRLHSIWLSFRNLPGWLQGWVALILMPLNGASLLLLDTFSGQAIALAQSVSPITVVAGGIGSLFAGLFGFIGFFRRR